MPPRFNGIPLEAEQPAVVAPAATAPAGGGRFGGIPDGPLPSIGDVPASRAGGMPQPSRSVSSVVNQRDPGVDYYTGVADALLRAGFSRMSNDNEKARFLYDKVGPGNFGKDSYGAWYLKPAGLAKLGIKSDTPISIDEQRLSRYDAADLAGDIPALVGAAGYGIAATGMGALPGMAMTALGGMAGKSLDEILKVIQGYNTKGPGEMAGDIAVEGAMAAGGEGAVRLGGKALNFYRGKSSPERQQLTREALNAGLTPKTYQFFDPGRAPLLTRFQATTERVLGDPSQEKNREALLRMTEIMQNRAGTQVDDVGERLVGTARTRISGMETDAVAAQATATQQLHASLAQITRSLGSRDPNIGANVSTEIRAARRRFGDAASQLYAQVDQEVGAPFIPTASLKAEAERIAANLPRTEEGRVIFTKSGEANPIEDILNLPENITLAQAQRIRTMLRDGAEVRDLAPGVDKRDLGLLKNASERMFDDASNSLGFTTRSTILGPDGKPLTTTNVLPPDTARRAIEGLRRADAFYKDNIRKFDAPTIAAITREASQTGAVEPDRILDYIIRPGYSAAAARVKSLVSEQTWGKVSRAHFDELLESSKGLAGGQEVVSGKRLFDKVQDLGKTLDVVYGAEAPRIRRYAAELAALDGKLDPASLGAGNFAGALQAAVTKQRELNAFLSDNYLAQLAKPGQEAEQAVDFIFKEKSPERILKARQFYGANSREFQGLQNAAMNKLLSSFVAPSDDPLVKVLSGAELKKQLDKYGASTLKATFGEDLTRDLYKFASLSEFVTKQGPMGAGGIVAANVALHPIGNIGKLSEFFLLGRLLRTPGAIRYLTEGINPTTPPAQAAAALARVSALSAAILEDKTGSASVVLDPPERPR